MKITSDTVFAVPNEPIENPGLWRGDSFAGSDDWALRWPDTALAELDAAVRDVQKGGKRAPDFGRDEFPLPTLRPMLRDILNELETGRGFTVAIGLPLEEYDEDKAEILFWGLALHLGQPVSQNAKGHLLGHVRDLGLDITDTKVRNYQTTEELLFHNDSCDVLFLMCRRRARRGGQSRLASVSAMFNEMIAEDPELTRELFRPFAFDRRGEPGRPDEDDTPYFVLPILSYHEGYLTARMTSRPYIDSAQRFADAPPLTDKMIAALDLMEEITNRPEVSFEFDMRPGDIQLINNYSVFHARTEYDDFEEPDKKRHILRTWLSTDNSRPLPPWFENRWGSVKGGDIRGGIFPSLVEGT